MAKIKLDPNQLDQAVKEFIRDKFDLEVVPPLAYNVNLQTKTIEVEVEVKSVEKI